MCIEDLKNCKKTCLILSWIICNKCFSLKSEDATKYGK